MSDGRRDYREELQVEYAWLHVELHALTVDHEPLPPEIDRADYIKFLRDEIALRHNDISNLELRPAKEEA